MEQNPFTFGSMITDPKRFIGRRAELTTIIDRLNGVQAQGSAVVGPRRIGKSSLLHYLYRPREDEPLRPTSGVPIIYLSAADGQCETPEQFRTTLMLKILSGCQFDRRKTVERELDDLHQQITAAQDCPWSTARNVLERLPHPPIICLDEFEALLTDPFDDRFFNSLRSWANEGLLNWITASAQPLQELRTQHSLTSPFFNLLATVHLGELTDDEAQSLLTIADNTPYKFDNKEKQELQKTAATNYPYHLQIVAWNLWRMKAANNVNYSLIREELCRQPSPPPHCRKRGRPDTMKILMLFIIIVLLGLLIWQAPTFITSIGDVLSRIIQGIGTLGDFVGGAVFLILAFGVIWAVIRHRKPIKQELQNLWKRLG